MFPIKCTACRFSTGNAISGVGSKQAKLIVVTDRLYKGDEEAREACRDVKQSLLLRKAITHFVGLDETEIYWTTLLKCNPTKKEQVRKSKDVVIKSVEDRKIDLEKQRHAKDWSKEIKTCRSWLDRELEILDTPLVLLAGEQSVATFAPSLAHPWISHGERVWDAFYEKWFISCFSPKHINDFSSYTEKGHRQILTGSLPWLFQRDLVKLKNFMEEVYE